MGDPHPSPGQESEPPAQQESGLLTALGVKQLAGMHMNRRAALGFAVGAVSFTASIVAIAEFLRADNAPTDRTVQITDIRLITWETLGEFLDRLKNREQESLDELAPNLEAFSSAQLNLAGVVAHYHIELIGFRNDPVQLLWTMYDAQTRRMLEDPAFRGQPAFPEKFVLAHSSSDQRTGELWIPTPLVPGSYYAVLEVWDANNNRAHSLLTPEFSVRRNGTIGL